MKRRTRVKKLEPEFTQTCTLIRKKVSYINVSSIHVILIQLCDVATSEKIADNQEERKKLTRQKGELQYYKLSL